MAKKIYDYIGKKELFRRAQNVSNIELPKRKELVYSKFEFRKRSFETGKGYKHGVRAFYEAWDKTLGGTDRTVRGYIHSLSKVCGFFSIGIKDGFYRITSRICFKKPAKGQEGHRYDQDMYNEQSVRMDLRHKGIYINAFIYILISYLFFYWN